MEIKYKKEIHVYDDSKKDHEKIWVKQRPITCCDKMKKDNGNGLVIATHESETCPFDEQTSHKNKFLDKPVLSIVFKEEYQNPLHIPIKFCPFCAELITTKCVETKKKTHTCKKEIKQVEECEDIVTEEIIVK